MPPRGAQREGVKKAASRGKKKSFSKVASGPHARRQVMSGIKEKTKGRLTRDLLVKNKDGKIVSIKASAAGRKRYLSSPIKLWFESVSAARKALRLTKFVAVNGKSPEGQALYASAKALYSAARGSSGR